MPLNVWGRCIVAHGPKAPSLSVASGHGAGAFPAMFKDGRRHSERPFQCSPNGHIGLGRPTRHIINMVLQVCPNLGPIELDLNTQLLELLGWANAGKHQDLRRVERSCRQDDAAPSIDHFAPLAAPHANASNSTAFDYQPFDQRVGADRDIVLIADRLNIGARSRPSFALALGHLVKAEPGLATTVKVIIGWQL